MKKSILILAAIIVSLIGVNAQQSIIDQIQEIEFIEESQLDLYESLVDDFNNYHSNNTQIEMIEDEVQLCLYTDIYDNMELHNLVEAEIKMELENNKTYKTIKEDLEIYDVLSITKIAF